MAAKGQRMSAGDVWKLPDGQRALEIRRSGRQLLLCVMNPHWPFPAPPITMPVSHCRREPSRYLHGQVPADLDDMEEAPW